MEAGGPVKYLTSQNDGVKFGKDKRCDGRESIVQGSEAVRVDSFLNALREA